MIIDAHGHVTAPDSLYVYKAQILAHRGAHGRGGNLANDEDVKKALNAPVFGGEAFSRGAKRYVPLCSLNKGDPSHATSFPVGSRLS